LFDAEDGREAAQPSDDAVGAFDPWADRLFDHIEGCSAYNDDDALDVNGVPTCRAEPLFRTRRLMSGITEVVLRVPVDEKPHGGDPDPLPGMVFRVDREDTRGAHDDVIDICAFRRDDHAAFDAPALVGGEASFKERLDRVLPVRPAVPQLRLGTKPFGLSGASIGFGTQLSCLAARSRVRSHRQ
jgi:hypothetical protein